MSGDASVPLLVLGLGNVLCGDDGLGVVAVERLRERYEEPRGVRFLDGGTLGLSLLSWIEAAERLLLVDAVRTGETPGTLVELQGDEVAPAVRDRLSVHQIGVADLLDSLQLLGRYPPELQLVGLVPLKLELEYGLSAPVAAQLPRLVDRVAQAIAASGFVLEPRQERLHATPPSPLTGLAGPGDPPGLGRL